MRFTSARARRPGMGVDATNMRNGYNKQQRDYFYMATMRNTRLFDMHEVAFPVCGIDGDMVDAMYDNQETDQLIIDRLRR